jgi:hypothetical protein
VALKLNVIGIRKHQLPMIRFGDYVSSYAANEYGSLGIEAGSTFNSDLQVRPGSGRGALGVRDYYYASGGAEHQSYSLRAC